MAARWAPRRSRVEMASASQRQHSASMPSSATQAAPHLCASVDFPALEGPPFDGCSACLEGRVVGGRRCRLAPLGTHPQHCRHDWGVTCVNSCPGSTPYTLEFLYPQRLGCHVCQLVSWFSAAHA